MPWSPGAEVIEVFGERLGALLDLPDVCFDDGQIAYFHGNYPGNRWDLSSVFASGITGSSPWARTRLEHPGTV